MEHMEAAPSDPETFFSSYLRGRFARARERFGTLTSVGSLACRVPGAGEWSLRLVEGELEVSRGMEDDVMLQITVPVDDFVVLVAEAADRLSAAAGPPAAGVAAVRALGMKPETARLVRHVPGSVLFVVRDGEIARRLLVTPGRRKADLDSVECTIECKMADLLDAQSKGLPPMQLFVAGKLKITGNVQIAMALAGMFA
jgi:hypothetical protein